MTPAQLSHDLQDALQTRRDRDTWRAIAREAIHSLAAAYDRITQLETQKAELYAERERVARMVFRDAPMKEQR